MHSLLPLSIFQNFDLNKVHFNQNLESKSSRFQSKASAAADLARRAWLRRTRDVGGTTIRFRIFRRRGGALGRRTTRLSKKICLRGARGGTPTRRDGGGAHIEGQCVLFGSREEYFERNLQIKIKV